MQTVTVSVHRFGAKGSLKMTRSEINDRWTWTLYDANGAELAFGIRSFTRSSDAKRSAGRCLAALQSLRPRLRLQ
jgi:hypothetical protein